MVHDEGVCTGILGNGGDIDRDCRGCQFNEPDVDGVFDPSVAISHRQRKKHTQNPESPSPLHHPLIPLQRESTGKNTWMVLDTEGG